MLFNFLSFFLALGFALSAQASDSSDSDRATTGTYNKGTVSYVVKGDQSHLASRIPPNVYYPTSELFGPQKCYNVASQPVSITLNKCWSCSVHYYSDDTCQQQLQAGRWFVLILTEDFDLKKLTLNKASSTTFQIPGAKASAKIAAYSKRHPDKPISYAWACSECPVTWFSKSS